MSATGRPVVYFHIGAPKTGTTYLQHVLWKNRAALRRDGVLYPGDAAPSHFWASLDLRETGFKGHRPPGVEGAWARVVDEVRSWGGTAVIDHETFGRASEKHVDRALADLAFAEVHLVFTARDLVRQLPAAWQERMKNRELVGYGEFLDTVRPSAPSTALQRSFWEAHSAPDVLARWARDVPPERVHVVTVPPSGAAPGLLWQRFAGVLGVDPERYDTEVTGANTSLGAAEAAVVRQLNLALKGTNLAWPAYSRIVKHGLSTELARRRGARITVPDEAYAWAVDWSRQAVADLTAAGYDVVGDLDELVPAARPDGEDPDTVPVDEQAAAAVAGMAALVRHQARASRRRSAGPSASGMRHVVGRARRGGGRAVNRVLGRRVTGNDTTTGGQ